MKNHRIKYTVKQIFFSQIVGLEHLWMTPDAGYWNEVCICTCTFKGADRVNAGRIFEPVCVQFFQVDGRGSVKERLSADVGRKRLTSVVETSRKSRLSREMPDEHSGQPPASRTTWTTKPTNGNGRRQKNVQSNAKSIHWPRGLHSQHVQSLSDVDVDLFRRRRRQESFKDSWSAISKRTFILLPFSGLDFK